jgi:hypothetical protein
MIIGKENVTQFIRYNKTPYWRIKRSESEQHFVANSGDEESLPLEESIMRLGQVFNILSPGNYFIEAWTTKGQTKSWNRDHFQILPENSAFVGSAQIQHATNSSMDVQTEIQKALTNYKQEVELAELRRKVGELEKENRELQASAESALGRIWTKVEPYINTYMGSNVKTGELPAIGKADVEQKRLETAFETWQEKEPDVITLVEKIAGMSHKDPGTYQMARQMLLNS